MATIVQPLATAAILFCLGIAGVRLYQHAGVETDEMQNQMVFRLLLGPLCLAVLVLVADGISDHLYLIRWLQR